MGVKSWLNSRGFHSFFLLRIEKSSANHFYRARPGSTVEDLGKA